MIISTVNVNGIRAAVRQRSAANPGLLGWLARSTADIVCLQETRADDDQVASALAPVIDEGWHLVSASANVKGRNGVAILSRWPFAAVRVGVHPDDEFAAHGRYLEADLDGAPLAGRLTVASVYIHTGEAGTPRQLEKERFMAALAKRMALLSGESHDVVVCGDWNIAHTENDIKAWKANVAKSGFLPSERAWLTELLADGWVDVVRRAHPGRAGPYSWWSWRGRAFDNDAGWRIDYQLANTRLAERVVGARVERPAAYALRWSDHAPVTVEYGPVRP
ncbi:exodeoxyribonuclease III [Mycobacterium botniense]|uniref:Putative exodeoxyribonuclease n=1 Tax=Mycobacterium botniense TaxID=84962 RepID=A0A7I9XT59_9MYCO|nr:exodeoxyribonuclease III [Mycobacterium botniense]GFG72988.1 putative exodeoxyribonuclease [Mycobacterium botniense]